MFPTGKDIAKYATPSPLTPNMTDVQLEDYMALVASKVDELGIHYVNRQVQWAEDQLIARGVVAGVPA